MADVAGPPFPPVPLAPLPAYKEIIPEVSTLRSLVEPLSIYRFPTVSPQMTLGVGTPAEVAFSPSPEKVVRLDPEEEKKILQIAHPPTKKDKKTEPAIVVIILLLGSTLRIRLFV